MTLLLALFLLRAIYISAYISKDHHIEFLTSGDLQLIVIRNFFNATIAEYLSNSLTNNPEWVYASNHDLSNINKKFRGNEEIDARRRAVQTHDQRGVFAYSKFELEPDNAIVTLLRNIFLEPEVLAFVSYASSLRARGITDLFVTRYSEGDFHNDGLSGSLAFTINFTQEWSDAHGGVLEFACEANGNTRDSPICLRIPLHSTP
jgi:hypothetical protein